MALTAACARRAIRARGVAAPVAVRTCARMGLVPSGSVVSRRSYFTETIGLKAERPSTRGDLDRPLYFLDDRGLPVSPWHDIPLQRSEAEGAEIVNCVIEIPRGTTPKWEIDTCQSWNPIVMDTTKDGRPRSYAFPSLTNYGALPQTYENPSSVDPLTGLAGDGDPLDVCEIGVKQATTGSVYAVRVLGSLALVDGGETDWKVLAVRADDPLAQTVTDVATAPATVLRLMDDIKSWFERYKIAEGKGRNTFALRGEWQDRATTLRVIADCHHQWRQLVADKQAAGASGTTSGDAFGETAAFKLTKSVPWVWGPNDKRSVAGGTVVKGAGAVSAMDAALAGLRLEPKYHLL